MSFVSKCFRVYKPLYPRVYPCCDWRVVLGARSMCAGVGNQLQQLRKPFEPREAAATE